MRGSRGRSAVLGTEVRGPPGCTPACFCLPGQQGRALPKEPLRRQRGERCLLSGHGQNRVHTMEIRKKKKKGHRKRLHLKHPPPLLAPWLTPPTKLGAGWQVFDCLLSGVSSGAPSAADRSPSSLRCRRLQDHFSSLSLASVTFTYSREFGAHFFSPHLLLLF